MGAAGQPHQSCIDLTTDLATAVNKVTALTDAAITAYRDAAVADDDTEPFVNYAVVSLGSYAQPGAVPTEYRTLPVPLATKIWNAIRNGGDVTLPIHPDDLFGWNGADIVSCSRELPVIRHLGLVLQSDVGTAPLRTINKARIGVDQAYAVGAGAERYTLINPSWTALGIPVLYAAQEGAVDAALRDAIATNHAGPIVGFSPFTNFHITFDPGMYEAWNFDDAVNVYLVMEVETSRSADSLDWVNRCNLD